MYYCNPLNLPYKYQFFNKKPKESRQSLLYREAADPSLVLFKGRYYLFLSMTAGFFVSDNLVDWQYHEFTTEMPIYGYAPDACVVGDNLVFSASRIFEPFSFFRTKDPVNEPFERVLGSFPFWDPHMFLDEDQRLYFFWGCSNQQPILGVELDRETLKPLSEPIPLIQSDHSTRGYERCGNDHQDSSHSPFIEGAWVTKHNGRYYLHYATPGTEYDIYADGIFVSDHPLGPYELAENNPFSYQPGGFLRGAGHGSSLKDKDGNYWHISTASISINDPFERRIGLWKAGFDRDGEFFCDQRYGDFPIKADAPAFSKPEWMLLSYGKKVTSSGGMGANFVTDEDIHTWWKGKCGDSITLDLGRTMDVHAVQINFADEKMVVEMPDKGQKLPYWERYIEVESGFTQWLLEGSQDGINFSALCDKRQALTDLPHDLIVWDGSQKVRFVRLTIHSIPYGNPCISGLRVFGKAEGDLPEVPKEISLTPIGDLELDVQWKGNAVGYVVLWGYAPGKLYHSCTVFGKNQYHIGALIKGQKTFVRVDAFNESGISEGNETPLAYDTNLKKRSVKNGQM